MLIVAAQQSDMTARNGLLADQFLESKFKISSITALTDIQPDIQQQMCNQALADAKAEKYAKKMADKQKNSDEESEQRQKIFRVLKQGDLVADQVKFFEEFEEISKNEKNSKLYKLLAEIKAFAEHVQIQENVAKIIQEMRLKLRDDFEIKTQKNSPILSILVRYVTRTNRKNACVYAKVLRIAECKKIHSSELEAFIIKNGGISNLKEDLTEKKKEKINMQRMWDAWSRYGMNKLHHKVYIGETLGTLDISEKQKNDYYDSKGNSSFIYMFGKLNNGKLSVIDFVPSTMEEQEYSCLADYASFELYRLGSLLGKEEADKEFINRYTNLFKMYNTYFEKFGIELRLNMLGETINSDRKFGMFDKNYSELQEVYAEQQSLKNSD